MFEKSTSDARPDEDADPHRCVAGGSCRAVTVTDDGRQAATTELPDILCNECTKAVSWAVDDLPAMWVALHAAIGDHTRRQSQRVSASRTAPINLNVDVDALKGSIVEWLVAAAAPIAEQLNIDDPAPRNGTDVEHARIVDACTRIIAPHIHRLVALPADDVTIWLTGSETEYPGERCYVDDNHITHHGTSTRRMTGPDIALKLAHLHGVARSLLAITTPRDKMPLPCPHCNAYELARSHRTLKLVSGHTKEIDQIDCGACKLSWPYERYQQLIHIWVKEDEMEREKLQKKLDDEVKRRELCEWLAAEREWLLSRLEWQLGIGLEQPDEVTAAQFARSLIDVRNNADADEVYMTDKDIAVYLQVSESTVRSWATRGHITRHTADDGSTQYLAHEVWDYYRASRQSAGDEAKVTA